MDTFLDLFGIRFFEVTFCVSFLLLLYVTSYQLVIQSSLLFVYLIISQWIVRKNGARKLCAAGRSVLITGCDSGFGNGIARLLDRHGMNVFATCLSENSDGAEYLKEVGSSRMKVLQMDVTSDESVMSCLQKVKAACRKEGLWALVNNAGIGLRGECEISSMSVYKKVAEVNLFGTVRVCKAFLPLIRMTKGRVVNVTSVHGLHAHFTASAYGMSKYGVEGFSDCLRLEMRRFGVKIIIVEPGQFGLATGITSEETIRGKVQIYRENIEALSEEVQDAYGQEYLNRYLKIRTVKKPDTYNKKSGTSDADISDLLATLEDAILSTQPHSRYLVSGPRNWIDHDVMMARLNQILPASLMDWVYFQKYPLPKEAFSSTLK